MENTKWRHSWSTPNQEASKNKEKWFVEAKWIKDQHLDIQGEDRNYILSPEENLENMKSGHLQAWLCNVKMLIKASEVQFHNLIRTMDTRQYLLYSSLRGPTCSVRTKLNIYLFIYHYIDFLS